MSLSKVLKFGGSSVGSAERINQVIDVICAAQAENPVLVVVSAFEKVTDTLLEAAHTAARGNVTYKELANRIRSRHLDVVGELSFPDRERVKQAVSVTLSELDQALQGIFLLKEISPRTLDLVASFGERLSAYIISEALKLREKSATFADAREFIRTDTSFGNALVNFELTNRLCAEYCKSHPGLLITTGFVGSSDSGETTTLGRGGSDYTASIIGAALEVHEIEIWTDVDGVLSADPRKVKNAVQLKTLTYEEAMELSHFGAKVIHPPTMLPALRAEIPIRIKNTFNPKHPGTWIGPVDLPSLLPVKGITSISQISLFRLEGGGMVGVPGIASRLFGALARGKISVILISQASSEHTICFAIPPGQSNQAKKFIEAEFDLEIKAGMVDSPIIEEELAIVAVVGERMRHTPGIAGKLFHTLGKNGVNVVAIAQGSSELNISVVIPRRDESKALNAIHDAFFLSDVKSEHIFLIGTGQVGKKLLSILKDQDDYLRREQSIKYKLVGVANSKKMAFNPAGIPLNAWEDVLKNGSANDIQKFINEISTLNLPHSILVDCTASDEIAEQYPALLAKNISIVTPNKRANSGPLERYVEIKESLRRSNVRYMFETTVGAGLPVIGTLHDLLSSGDKVVRIEAVLSGTLSFILNSLNAEKSFSALVREAKDRGYTEPDPRDDLSGKDVARKLLILARECGMLLKEDEVKVESLVPKDCAEIKSIDEFFKKLSTHDVSFEDQRKKAEGQGKVLRFVAAIDEDGASVSLRAVSLSHPLGMLSGSDNSISFTTTRYSDRPLVVRGPGAGVEVTAAGVFADLLKVSHFLA